MRRWSWRLGLGEWRERRGGGKGDEEGKGVGEGVGEGKWKGDGNCEGESGGIGREVGEGLKRRGAVRESGEEVVV